MSMWISLMVFVPWNVLRFTRPRRQAEVGSFVQEAPCELRLSHKSQSKIKCKIRQMNAKST
jgi:hypothetical protein